MAFSTNVWDQLKNLTVDEIIRALKRDGWQSDQTRGATLAFIKKASPNQRVVIHYHPQKTYGPQFLKGILQDIGWDEKDFRRLKLIK